MDSINNKKPIQRTVKIIHGIARIAGTTLMLFAFFIFINGGGLSCLELLSPFILSFVLIFIWDRWKIMRIPVILCILASLAIPFFMLDKNSIIGAIGAINSLSMYMMVLGMILALKWEGIGGALAIIGWVVLSGNMLWVNIVPVVFYSPFLMIGIMYLFCWVMSKRPAKPQTGMDA